MWLKWIVIILLDGVAKNVTQRKEPQANKKREIIKLLQIYHGSNNIKVRLFQADQNTNYFFENWSKTGEDTPISVCTMTILINQMCALCFLVGIQMAG